MEAITGPGALIRYPGTTDDFVRRIAEPRRTLPTEVVSYACSFLSVSNRVITSFVCTRWRFAASQVHTSGLLTDPRYSWITSLIRPLHQLRISPTDEDMRQISDCDAILSIVKTLLENRDQIGALEIAYAIPYKGLRSRALSFIARDFTKTNVEEAGKVALMIPNEETRGRILSIMTYELLEGGNIKGAMEIAILKNPDTHLQKDSIFLVTRAFLKDGRFKEAKEFAYTIPFEGAREKAFSEIAFEEDLRNSQQQGEQVFFGIYSLMSGISGLLSGLPPATH